MIIPFPVKVISQSYLVMSRHQSIHDARITYSLPRLNSRQLNLLKVKKIIKVHDIYLVSYNLSRNNIIELINDFKEKKTNDFKEKELVTLNNNFKKLNKIGSNIVVLNKDFTIDYVWKGKTIELAKKLGINYTTLKSSLSKFGKYKKEYLSGVRKRDSEKYYTYLKDILN